MKELLLGNHALARGAWEAGVAVAAAYPGTPSTEITEEIAAYEGLHAEWSPNEKVALEVAVGASVAGGRALCCMKHVGLNVAADPLFTAAYTGVNGGLVVVVADDPGMHSSQNEQDSRYYARSAHLPMLEPSDAQEAYDFVKTAFAMSEEYDTPVLVRMTTRVSHARGVVETGARGHVPLRAYKKDMMKYVMMPGMARGRHLAVEAREKRLSQDAAKMEANRVEWRGRALGVVCSGAAYHYVREALPDASTLKLALVYPLSEELMRSFAAGVERLIVVEELEPFIEDALKAMGIACSGKDKTGLQGELSVRKIAAAYGAPLPEGENLGELPARPPVLCPGCPHRAVYNAIKKLSLRAFGDIGCYTLGALPPLSGLDTCLCMGAGIGMAHGAEKARGAEFGRGSVAIIGDSTFLHTGIQPLINAVYNQSGLTLLILDNRTTGMTGHQEHAATGKNLRGQEAPALDLAALCAACGCRYVVTVDPFDTKALETALAEETARGEASVIIARRPCALLQKSGNPPKVVLADSCKKCGACLRIGCPAVHKQDGPPSIDVSQCTGCGQCQRVCRFQAIVDDKGGRA